MMADWESGIKELKSLPRMTIIRGEERKKE